MKILNSLALLSITIIGLSSCKQFTLEGDDAVVLMGDGKPKIYEDEVNHGSVCFKAIRKTCEPLANRGTVEQITNHCENYYQHAQCKKLYEEGFESLDECKGKNKEFIDLYYNFRKPFYLHSKVLCSLDNDNKICPFVKISQVEDEEITDDLFWSVVNESCKSEDCIGLFDLILEKEYGAAGWYSDFKIEKFKQAAEYVKSQNCTSQTRPRTTPIPDNSKNSNNKMANSQSSDAIRCYTNGILLMTMITVLLNFF